ncbi:hypothetical protein CR513_55250, partial [Mucuna pruriens]
MQSTKPIAYCPHALDLGYLTFDSFEHMFGGNKSLFFLLYYLDSSPNYLENASCDSQSFHHVILSIRVNSTLGYQYFVNLINDFPVVGSLHSLFAHWVLLFTGEQYSPPLLATPDHHHATLSLAQPYDKNNSLDSDDPFATLPRQTCALAIIHLSKMVLSKGVITWLKQLASYFFISKVMLFLRLVT